MPQPSAIREPAPPRETLADAISATPDAPPPHRLWATLESAYAPAPALASARGDRLAPRLALPLAVGVSLALWAVIVQLVLMR